MTAKLYHGEEVFSERYGEDHYSSICTPDVTAYNLMSNNSD